MQYPVTKFIFSIKSNSQADVSSSNMYCTQKHMPISWFKILAIFLETNKEFIQTKEPRTCSRTKKTQGLDDLSKLGNILKDFNIIKLLWLALVNMILKSNNWLDIDKIVHYHQQNYLTFVTFSLSMVCTCTWQQIFSLATKFTRYPHPTHHHAT